MSLDEKSSVRKAWRDVIGLPMLDSQESMILWTLFAADCDYMKEKYSMCRRKCLSGERKSPMKEVSHVSPNCRTLHGRFSLWSNGLGFPPFWASKFSPRLTSSWIHLLTQRWKSFLKFMEPWSCAWSMCH